MSMNTADKCWRDAAFLPYVTTVIPALLRVARKLNLSEARSAPFTLALSLAKVAPSAASRTVSPAAHFQSEI